MKTWLITGAGSGLGCETARYAIENGDQVAVNSRSKDKLQDLVDLAPDRVLPLALDVTDLASRKNALKRIRERFSALDFLVNNAGRGYFSAVEDETPEDMRAVFETNYFGPVRMIQEALPLLRESTNGVIVNLSSMGVHFDQARGNSLYLASKAALDVTSKVLRNELVPFNIQVMLVEPGAFRTNFRVGGIEASGEQSALYRESYADVELLRANPFSQSRDPEKAGRAIVEAVNQDEVPRVLVLGKGMIEVEEESLTA